VDQRPAEAVAGGAYRLLLAESHAHRTRRAADAPSSCSVAMHGSMREGQPRTKDNWPTCRRMVENFLLSWAAFFRYAGAYLAHLLGPPLILRFNFRAYSWHYLFLLLLVRWFFSFREHVWRRGVQCACSGAWKIGEQLRLFDSCRRRRSAEHCAPLSARAGRAARRGARPSRMTSPCGDGLRVAAQRGARWARRGCGPGAAPRQAQKEQTRA